MKKAIRCAGAMVLLAGAVGAGLFAKSQTDVSLPQYKMVSGVTGNLNVVGSDTLNNLMALWAQAFAEIYPNVNIQVQGKGSRTAVPALIQSTAQIAAMSRPMSPVESAAFEKNFGYAPAQIRVAIDAVALFVHKDNPLTTLSLRQADAIFSLSCLRGEEKITRWNELGLSGEFARHGITAYGCDSSCGTFDFFQQAVLKKGDNAATVNEQSGCAAVVQAVTGDPLGIGYASVTCLTANVRALKLSVGDGGQAYAPTLQNSLSGDYPLARFLYVYVNRHPVRGVDTLTREFLKFILSQQGRRIAVDNGYFPLPENIAAQTAALSEEL